MQLAGGVKQHKCWREAFLRPGVWVCRHTLARRPQAFFSDAAVQIRRRRTLVVFVKCSIWTVKRKLFSSFHISGRMMFKGCILHSHRKKHTRIPFLSVLPTLDGCTANPSICNKCSLCALAWQLSLIAFSPPMPSGIRPRQSALFFEDISVSFALSHRPFLSRHTHSKIGTMRCMLLRMSAHTCKMR